MANPFPEELTEEEEALRLRRDISNLNIQQSNRSNIIRGLDIGEITNDSARRIIDDINAEQSGVVSPLGVAPPVAAGDPNLQNRQDIRAIFNNAGVESENKGQPANGEVGFTPPVNRSSPIDIPPRGGAVPSMADVERAGRGVLNVDVPPHELANQIPSSAEDLAQQQFAKDNSLDLFEAQLETDFPSIFERNLKFDDRGMPIGEVPTSGGGFFEGGRDLLRGTGDLFRRGFPSLARELPEIPTELAAAATGKSTPGTAGRAVVEQGISSVFDTAFAAGEDFLRPLGTINDFVADFARGGPRTAQAEQLEVDDPDPTGNQVVEPQGQDNMADAAERAAQDAANLRVPPGPAEPAVSTSFVSDEAGQESAAVGFEETPTGLSVTFPEVDGPPLEGTEIIRGLDRSFQPFAPGAGEIPFGDDPIERLQNTGFTRDQIPDVIGAQAQALLARGNAYKAATITGEDGRDYLGFTFVDENGEGQTIRLDQLASVGDNLLQLPFEIPYTDPLGDTIALESTRVVEIFRDPETDEVILRAVRQDDTADIEAMKRDNPDVWTAVQAQAAKENKGEPRALELLKLFLEQNQ
jgi:hypothetical protein